jgi:hypothetical protein
MLLINKSNRPAATADTKEVAGQIWDAKVGEFSKIKKQDSIQTGRCCFFI